MKVSEFELKVLRAISNGVLPEGNKRIAWVSAARRLEKKGLAIKSRAWYTTEAGDKILARTNEVPWVQPSNDLRRQG